MGSRFWMTGLPALQPFERFVLLRRSADLDDRNVRLPPPRRRRARALPLGRETGVGITGCDGGGALGGHLRRRPTGDAPTGLVLGLRTALPRRLDAGRLARLLGVVRRPRRIAESLRLMTGAQLQQRLERSDGLVDPRSGIAARGIQRR